MSIKTNRKNSDAVSILHRRYIKDSSERKASLKEERVKAQVAQLIYDLRKEAGLSQQKLAEMIGTTQSVISRLEDADYDGHSLSMLERISRALNKKIKIEAVNETPKATQVRIAFQTLIRLLRKNMGLNVTQFAEKLSVDPDNVIELEQNSSYRPPPRVLYRLSKFFKIPQQILNVLAGAAKQIPPDLESQASQFAAQSDSFAKLTEDEKNLLDNFVKFLRQASK